MKAAASVAPRPPAEENEDAPARTFQVPGLQSLIRHARAHAYAPQAVLAGDAGPAASPSGNLKTLWEIGQADGRNGEFALGPQDYEAYREDGFFIVGRSDARRSWPYVHPGPMDGWAGGRPHTFSIVFGLKTIARGGTLRPGPRTARYALPLAAAVARGSQRPGLRGAVTAGRQ